MLTLLRCPEEVICIGDDIKIKVLNVQGQQVKFGIAAPTNVSIHRQEIHRKMKKAQEDSRNLAEETTTLD